MRPHRRDRPSVSFLNVKDIRIATARALLYFSAHAVVRLSDSMPEAVNAEGSGHAATEVHNEIPL